MTIFKKDRLYHFLCKHSWDTDRHEMYEFDIYARVTISYWHQMQHIWFPTQVNDVFCVLVLASSTLQRYCGEDMDISDHFMCNSIILALTTCFSTWYMCARIVTDTACIMITIVIDSDIQYRVIYYIIPCYIIVQHTCHYR
jgi:hypothetical protein